MMARLLTAKEAADYLSLPVAIVTRLGIGRVRLGVSVRYDRKAIDHYLDALTGSGTRSPSIEFKDTPEAALERFAGRFDVSSRRP